MIVFVAHGSTFMNVSALGRAKTKVPRSPLLGPVLCTGGDPMKKVVLKVPIWWSAPCSFFASRPLVGLWFILLGAGFANSPRPPFFNLPKPRLGDPNPRLGVPKPKPRLGDPTPRLGDPMQRSKASGTTKLLRDFVNRACSVGF